MTVSIRVKFQPELFHNITTRRMIENAAYYMRDLWLSKSPNGGGPYGQGLQQPGSVIVHTNSFKITNFAKHAEVYEFGHRAFNLGLRMLERGRVFKRTKKGDLIKIMRIPDKKQTTRFRSPSVGAQTTKRFEGTLPRYIMEHGAVRKYQTSFRLAQPLKASIKGSGRSQFFVVSIQAIMRDRSKWEIPAMEGRHLGDAVLDEGLPVIRAQMEETIVRELDRQQKLGRTPQWYLRIATKSPIIGGEVNRGV